MVDQYKIPQNIDIEDKILGPFTLKQFLYLLGGSASIYILFNVFGGTLNVAFLAVSVPILLLTLALVFVKVNERPFVDFIFYFLGFLRQGKEKRWEKSSRIKKIEARVKLSEEEKGSQKELERLSKKGIVSSQLNRLSVILDTSGWSGDMKDEGLRGRIMSSGEEVASSVQKNLGKDQPLEDTFGDLEDAMERLLKK